MVPKRSHSSSSDTNQCSSAEQTQSKKRKQDTNSRLERRSILKLLGLSAVPLAIGSASAEESGYGTNGYGHAGYGETSSSDDEQSVTSPEVTTKSATNVTSSEVTLTGAVSGLNDVETVDCFFAWRAQGTLTWTETEKQSLSASNSFTQKVTGLAPNTEYEFRAVATIGRDTIQGETITITTEQDVTLENTILIDGVGTSEGSAYEFTVSGTVEPSTYKGASIDTDMINSGHVTGSVAGWRDAFRFSGDLESLSVDGQARVYVNDKRIDPSAYGSKQSSVLTIVGNGNSSEYEIVADGSLEVVEGEGMTVAEGSAEGTIQRGVHQFRFSGELVEFTFHDGGTQVYLEDQRLDPDDYNGKEELAHVIVFDGTDAAGSSRYRFTVNGEVTSSTYRGATIDADDSIDGTTVSGDVAAGATDAYWFDGEIDDFQLDGDASVDIKYNAR